MQDNKIIEQVGEAIKGKTPPAHKQAQKPLSSAEKHAIMDAVDQLFAELQLTYHNQYYKAFPSEEKIIFAKKLWFEHLQAFSPERILKACRQATRESEFLPTLHTIIKYCDVTDDELGLPDVYQAYVEACQAPNPKTDYRWSHPAVYWAGKASDWFFLANNTETKALPVFKNNYLALCERIKSGETLSAPTPTALPKPETSPLSGEETRSRIKELRKQIKL